MSLDTAQEHYVNLDAPPHVDSGLHDAGVACPFSARIRLRPRYKVLLHTSNAAALPRACKSSATHTKLSHGLCVQIALGRNNDVQNTLCSLHGQASYDLQQNLCQSRCMYCSATPMHITQTALRRRGA